MTDIMSADLPKAKSISKYIFQPRNHPEVLRLWLVHNGFSILKESLVRERRNLCEIIVVSPIHDTQVSQKGTDNEALFKTDLAWPEGDIRWEIPPWFVEISNPLVKEYLHKKLERELRVRREIQKSMDPDPKRQKTLDIRIDYLRNLCEKRESND